jgi:DNA-binding Lrp family transcriptional regulator
MTTAIIEVKVKLGENRGYSDIADIICEFKEVESVYLTSGNYDLMVMVNCTDAKQIGLFVSRKLSAIKGVENTATNFVMERYKQSGEILAAEKDERGLYTV